MQQLARGYSAQMLALVCRQQDTKEYLNQRGTFSGIQKGRIKGEVKRGQVVRE